MIIRKRAKVVLNIAIKNEVECKKRQNRRGFDLLAAKFKKKANA